MGDRITQISAQTGKGKGERNPDLSPWQLLGWRLGDGMEWIGRDPISRERYRSRSVGAMLRQADVGKRMIWPNMGAGQSGRCSARPVSIEEIYKGLRPCADQGSNVHTCETFIQLKGPLSKSVEHSLTSWGPVAKKCETFVKIRGDCPNV